MWYLLNHIYVEVRFTRKVILTFWNQHTNGFVNYTQETSLLQKKKKKKGRISPLCEKIRRSFHVELCEEFTENQTSGQEFEIIRTNKFLEGKCIPQFHAYFFPSKHSKKGQIPGLSTPSSLKFWTSQTNFSPTLSINSRKKEVLVQCRSLKDSSALKKMQADWME